MALLDDVKSELAAIDSELPAAKKAQATAMIRFGGGLRLVQRQIIVQAQFDSLKAAQWLQDTIRDLYGHEAVMTQVSRSTPNGTTVQRYMIHVERGGAALALQTGLLDRRKRLVRGLPADIISGNIAQVKAAWRGAFLAHGALSDPGKAGFLEIICPSNEAALALSGAARRLGITAKPRQLRSSERITLKDPDAIERMLILMGAPHSAREWTGKRTDGEARGKANRLANFDDANMRRSAKAAAEASEKVRRAFEILGDDIPKTFVPRASCALSTGMRALRNSDVSPTRPSPRMPSQAASAVCCSSPTRPRRPATGNSPARPSDADGVPLLLRSAGIKSRHAPRPCSLWARCFVPCRL